MYKRNLFILSVIRMGYFNSLSSKKRGKVLFPIAMILLVVDMLAPLRLRPRSFNLDSFSPHCPRTSTSMFKPVFIAKGYGTFLGRMRCPLTTFLRLNFLMHEKFTLSSYSPILKAIRIFLWMSAMSPSEGW